MLAMQTVGGVAATFLLSRDEGCGIPEPRIIEPQCYGEPILCSPTLFQKG